MPHRTPGAACPPMCTQGAAAGVFGGGAGAMHIPIISYVTCPDCHRLVHARHGGRRDSFSCVLCAPETDEIGHLCTHICPVCSFVFACEEDESVQLVPSATAGGA